MDKKTPHYYKEERPWGNFIEFAKNQICTVKIITVNPGEVLSLQSHLGRDEFWRIIKGSGEITIGEDVTQARMNDEFFVPKETKHRLAAPNEEMQVLEVAFGEFDEGDIIRYEDKYGRG